MSTHLHFDCFSGVSGDMVLGALVDAGLPIEQLAAGLKAVGLKGYRLRARRTLRAGVRATKVDVIVQDGARSPYSLPGIERLIRASRLADVIKETSLAVFRRLGGAEALAHGVPLRRVRFHEVGVVDSVVDIVGGVLGCHLLGAVRVTASPVNLGSGFVRFSHGRLPVPGPAVAALAKDVPVYSAGPTRELATPTGLALLCTMAHEFGPLPLMQPRAIGYGAGTADPEGWPNVLRIFAGDVSAHTPDATDVVIQIETNLDDLHPQAYETLMERLFDAGALDVTLTPVIMKRGRPGIIVTVLAPPEKSQTVARIILRETTALGVRMREVTRLTLPRHVTHVKVAGQDVRIKVAEVDSQGTKAAPEYADCKGVAERTGRPVREVMEDAMRVYRARSGRTATPARRGRKVRHGR